jgi:hypothetical protein
VLVDASWFADRVRLAKRESRVLAASAAWQAVHIGLVSSDTAVYSSDYARRIELIFVL